MTDSAEIAKQIRSALASTGEAFETIYPAARDRLVAALVPAFENLLTALDRVGDEARRAGTTPERYMIAWSLLWDACNGLLATHVLLERGYQTECLAAARTVLERVACALVLFDNSELIPRWNAGQLKQLGAKGMRPAGRVVPGLARMWGLYSRLGSHVGKDNTGTSRIGVFETDGRRQLHMAVGGQIHSTRPDRESCAAFVDELCRTASDLLAPAPDQILFSPGRARAEYSGG